jgi:hypothetical protein
MICPECGVEYRAGFLQCSDCHVALVDHVPAPDHAEDTHAGGNLDVLIKSGLDNPLAISLAKSLLQEAGIPFYAPENPAARQESGVILGWWDVRVPRAREAEAREILDNLEQAEDEGSGELAEPSSDPPVT